MRTAGRRLWGGGGTCGWVMESIMTARRTGAMGSNTCEVIRENTGLREEVVEGDWNFNVTVG